MKRVRSVSPADDPCPAMALMGPRCRCNDSQSIIKRHVITPTASLRDSHITVIAVTAGAGSMPSEPNGRAGRATST